MMPTILPMTLDLAQEQGARFTNARGTRIECRRGVLWITVDNDPRDVLLEVGQSFTLASSADTIVQAILGPAEVAVLQDCKDAACARVQPKETPSFLDSLRAALSWRPVPAP